MHTALSPSQRTRGCDACFRHHPLPQAFIPERFGPLDGPAPNEQNTDFRWGNETQRNRVRRQGIAAALVPARDEGAGLYGAVEAVDGG